MINAELMQVLSWIKLDKLGEAGKNDSDEAEAIRDNMDMYWKEMTNEQRDQTEHIIRAIAAAYTMNAPRS